MCLILVGIHARPGQRLLLLANRDEFHARAAVAAAPWQENAAVVGGRDQVAGGSWLAVHGSGRFAAVTNLRNGPPKPTPRSRGDLVRDFVLGQVDAQTYLDELRPQMDQFAPFNLIVGAGDQVLVLDGSLRQIRQLTPGLHAISNGPLDQDWPKMRRIRTQVQTALERDVPTLELLKILRDGQQAPDAQLPDTGFGLEWERVLSSIFITGQDYGTRASTVLEQADDGRIDLIEQRFGPMASLQGRDHWQHSSADGTWRPS